LTPLFAGCAVDVTILNTLLSIEGKLGAAGGAGAETLPGRSPFGGDLEGVAEVIGWLGRSFEASGGTIHLELHDVVANDEHAVSLFTARAERAGKHLADNTVLVFHMRNGKQTEVWFYPADLYATDEFWS